MDDAEKKQVSYGNLGTGSYDTKNKQWHFLRGSTDSTRLRLIEHAQIFPGLQAAPESEELSSFTYSMVPARERTQRINEILRMHPELIPGSPILPELEQISTAVTELEQVYEPLASECLAQGIVGYEDEGSVLMRLRSRRILASVTGSSKNLIRLSLVSEEYRSAQQGTTNLQIIMGRYDNDRAVLWGGQQKTSILQVLFSNEDGKGSFLAARRHTCVDVLKPMIRKATIRVRKLQRSEIGTVEISKSSQLDPNWILRISLQDSENVMIAGFAFNPWNYMECAILGTSGEIKVLEIQDPKRSRQIWTVIPKAESFIRLRETTARPNDGWGRILWIDNLGSILVATRKLICVYNFSEGDLVAGSLDSRIVSTDHCVLDINYDDKSHKHLFVLTSMSLIVYACGTMPDKEGTEGMQDILHNLVSVLHYRDTEDISLQINIASSAHEAYVLIHSRITSLVTGFRIGLDHRSSGFISISDPFMLDLTVHLSENKFTHQDEFMVKNLGVSDLSMKVLETEFTDDEAAIPDNLFPSIPPVLEILVLNDCHKCSRLVYVVERSDLVSSDLILTPFIDDGVDHFMMVSVRQRREDFVVDSEEDSENDGGLSSLPAQIRSGMKSTSSSEFMPIVTLINNRLQSSYDGTQVIREFDSALQTILKNCNETQTGVYTLIDLLSSSMPVDQIDVVSKKISILLASIRELPRQSSGARDRSLEIIQTIKIGSLLSQRMAKRPQGVNSEEELHIVQVYEKLLQLYLHILPANTSPAVNVWLENIIRQTTMQLVLSGHGIKLVNTAETSGTKDAEISMADNLQSQEFELPMRLRDENQDVIPSGSQRRRSKGSASISRPSTSTSIICPSSQQASDTESEYTQPLGSALADYIVFRPTSPLPQSMRKGIPEWQIGAQPSGDGWKSISRSVSQESLRIPRQDRKRKRDKGKGRADQTVADEMTPQLSNTKLVTSSQTNNVPSVRLDLDDLLIASQPISSQVLPMASQRLGTELFSSQLMPISSSQPVNHASSSQNKTKRFKKQSTIKKRPSGFR